MEKQKKSLFGPMDLTEGTCWKTILIFSLPVILSYLLQQVYSISDAAIVGGPGGGGRQRHHVAGVHLSAIRLRCQRRLLRGDVMPGGRPEPGRRAAVPGHPDHSVGGADGAADGPGPGAAESHAGVDQRDAGQCRGVSRRVYLLLHHLRGHRGPAVL